MDSKKITVAWWNCALSPTAKPNRGQPSENLIALSTIERLINQQQSSIIGLCEVCDETIDLIRNHLNSIGRKSYKIIDCREDGKRKTGDDICLIYDSSIATAIHLKNHYALIAGMPIKAASVVMVNFVFTKKPTYIFLSHWPSNLRDANAQKLKRTAASRKIREAADAIFESNPKCKIILMGDYNADPYDSEVEESIEATRDLELSHIERKRLFYNPFWSKLGEHTELPHNREKISTGTTYYCNGLMSRWRTYNQIMVSHTLTSEKHFKFELNSAKILHETQLSKAVITTSKGTAASIFDHLPISINLNIDGVTKNVYRKYIPPSNRKIYRKL